ncbi:MAG TPA: Uma2 family endonuclease [Gemmatimonadales bacterium]|jgi:Uma2 family endonuclease|nr:Uma2 family endonuclease [Gemmatimonadales bacterium]
MAIPLYVTPDMVRAMPDDGNRYETVHGELLVTPSPRYTHQRIIGRILPVLYAWCGEHGKFEVLTSPADVSLTPDSLVQPDVFVIPTPGDRNAHWRDLAHPVLVIEILSPGTARADRFTKRVHYQRSGIPTYWIVDGAAQLIEVWRPGDTAPAVERDELVWQPDAGRVELRLRVADLFR